MDGVEAEVVAGGSVAGGDELLDLLGRPGRRLDDVVREDGHAHAQPVVVEGGPHLRLPLHVGVPLARKSSVLCFRNRVRVRRREHLLHVA